MDSFVELTKDRHGDHHSEVVGRQWAWVKCCIDAHSMTA